MTSGYHTCAFDSNLNKVTVLDLCRVMESMQDPSLRKKKIVYVATRAGWDHLILLMSKRYVALTPQKDHSAFMGVEVRICETDQQCREMVAKLMLQGIDGRLLIGDPEHKNSESSSDDF